MSKKPKQWLIDPNKSAMENTWDAAKTAAAFLLRRIKLKCTKEEWHDIYSKFHRQQGVAPHLRPSILLLPERAVKRVVGQQWLYLSKYP